MLYSNSLYTYRSFCVNPLVRRKQFFLFLAFVKTEKAVIYLVQEISITFMQLKWTLIVLVLLSLQYQLRNTVNVIGLIDCIFLNNCIGFLLKEYNGQPCCSEANFSYYSLCIILSLLLIGFALVITLNFQIIIMD